MPLDSFVEIASPKSPKHLKKKHSAVSQVKCSPTFKEKVSSSKKIFIQGASSESQLTFTMKNKCFEEFESSFPAAIPEAFCEKFPATKANVFSKRTNQCKLKRSFSLPTIFTEHFEDFSTSKNCSWPSSSLQVCDIPLKIMAFEPTSQIKTTYGIAISQIDSVSSSYLTKDTNSTEELTDNASVSRRGSTSTVRERNDSIDSTFSQISISDIKEIEDSVVEETESRNFDTRWKARHARSKSDASCDFEKLENIDEVFSLPSSFSEKPRPQRKSIFEGTCFGLIFISGL